MPGATNSTLALANFQSTNAGGYSIVVGNPLGMATSSVATLTLLPAASNVVLNPGFEQPAVGLGGYAPGDSTDIPNWTVDSALPDGVMLGSAGTFGPNNGTQNLLLSGDVAFSTGGGVSQTIPTTPGMVYTVGINVATQYGFNPTGEGSPVAGQFNFGGEYNALIASSHVAFTTLFFQVTAEASSTVIDIIGSTNSVAGQLVVDNVYVAATPGAGYPPGIITQPSSSVNVPNDNPSFTVVAAGLPPFSYQSVHYNSNTPIANATSNTLTLTGVQFSNAGNYSVVVSNSLGSVTSSVAALIVLLDVDGNFQGLGTDNGLGAGSTYLTGWTVDGPPDGDGCQFAAAATTGNSEFGVANNGGGQVQLTGGSTYAVGGGISQTIATTPGTVYTISIDVASRGGNAVTGTFNFGGINTALAASAHTLVVQSWTVLASASNTLIDIIGYPQSSARQLIVNNIQVFPSPGGGVPPSIAQGPSPGSSTNFNGANSSFSVTAAGTEPFSYQWIFDQTTIAAATGPTLTVTNLQNSNGGSYSVIVTNQFGSVTSAVATLTVTAGKPFFVSTNQTNQFLTNYAGGLLNIAPVANGTAPLSYQWYFKSNAQSAVALAAATNSNLAFFPSTISESGTYSLVVTNIFGAVTGKVATVTVLPNQTLNWGFEVPIVSGYLTLAPGATNITDWIVDTNAADPDGVQWGFATPVANVPNNGTQIIQLTGTYGTGGGVSQTINTTPGQPYMVSIDVASRQGNAAVGQFVFGTNDYAITATANPFTTISWPVTASDTNTLIDVIGAANSGSAQLAIDNVLVVPFNPAIAINSDGTNIILGWTFGSVQEASAVSGPWTNVAGVTLPWT